MNIKNARVKRAVDLGNTLLVKQKLGRTILLDVMSKGLPYLFLPIFLKMMPLKEYGIYTFIIYIVTTGAYIFQFGFETAKSKLYFVYDEIEKGRMLFSMNLFLLLLFIVVAIIDLRFTVISTYLLNLNTPNNVALEFSILAYIFLNALVIVLTRHLTLTQKVLTFQIWNAFRLLLTNLAVVIAAFYLLSSTLSAYQRTVYEVVAGLLLLSPLYLLFYQKQFVYKFDLKIMRRVFELATPMMLGAVIAIAYNISDKYFIQKYIDYEALAVYNLTLFLVMPIGLLFTSFFDSYWVPKFFAENRHTLQIDKTNRATSIFALILAAALPVFLFFIAIYLKIINSTIQINTIALLFSILYISRSLDIISHFYNNFFIVTEKTYQLMTINIGFSLLAFTLNFLCIKTFGLIGAACILLLVSSLRLFIFFRKANALVAVHTA